MPYRETEEDRITKKAYFPKLYFKDRDGLEREVIDIEKVGMFKKKYVFQLRTTEGQLTKVDVPNYIPEQKKGEPHRALYFKIDTKDVQGLKQLRNMLIFLYVISVHGKCDPSIANTLEVTSSILHGYNVVAVPNKGERFDVKSISLAQDIKSMLTRSRYTLQLMELENGEFIYKLFDINKNMFLDITSREQRTIDRYGLDYGKTFSCRPVSLSGDSETLMFKPQLTDGAEATVDGNYIDNVIIHVELLNNLILLPFYTHFDEYFFYPWVSRKYDPDPVLRFINLAKIYCKGKFQIGIGNANSYKERKKSECEILADQAKAARHFEELLDFPSLWYQPLPGEDERYYLQYMQTYLLVTDIKIDPTDSILNLLVFNNSYTPQLPSKKVNLSYRPQCPVFVLDFEEPTSKLKNMVLFFLIIHLLKPENSQYQKKIPINIEDLECIALTSKSESYVKLQEISLVKQSPGTKLHPKYTALFNNMFPGMCKYGGINSDNTTSGECSFDHINRIMFLLTDKTVINICRSLLIGINKLAYFNNSSNDSEFFQELFTYAITIPTTQQFTGSSGGARKTRKKKSRKQKTTRKRSVKRKSQKKKFSRKRVSNKIRKY
jgi:hypothetical protein